MRNVIHGGYGAVERGHLLGVFWTLQIAYALSLVFAALGLSRLARDPTLRLVLIFAAVFTLLVSGLVSTTRWRIAFAFPLAIGAGLGVEALLRRRVEPSGWVAAALAILLLLTSAARPPAATIASGDFATPGELRRPDWFYFRY